MSARITRRRMIAASGAAVGAPLVLAACGQTTDADDDRSESGDPDLLNAILEQHLAVLDAAKAASGDGPIPVVVEEMVALREDSISKLESFISERDGNATTEPAEAPQAESPTEGLVLQLQDSIEASLASIGDLSSAAYRQAVHRLITEDAAAIAALRSQTGGEIAPDAFVFGAPTATEDSE